MPAGTAIFIRKNGSEMKYKVDESVPHCLECGEPLSYGRSDRKYCSETCKNRYHNREVRRWRSRYARVVGILQKNHEILSHLLRIGITSIPKTELAQLGYRLDFVTSCRKEGRRTVCHCFDIVFVETEGRLTKLALETDPWLSDVREID